MGDIVGVLVNKQKLGIAVIVAPRAVGIVGAKTGNIPGAGIMAIFSGRGKLPQTITICCAAVDPGIIT